MGFVRMDGYWWDGGRMDPLVGIVTSGLEEGWVVVRWRRDGY
jgi:hypothetical protein